MHYSGPRRHPVSRTCRLSLQALLLCAVVAGLASCGKPLFSTRDERTQYDRYDRVRNKYAPRYVYDEYGREIPNLRGRLAPKK